MKVEASRWIDGFDRLAHQAGACGWGITRAREVDTGIIEKMARWVAGGGNASMDYLRRHVELKRTPDSVLPGCRSVVSLVFPYYSEVDRRNTDIRVSRFALVPDYHKVLKKRLKPLEAFIKEGFGGLTRACVDSAPVAERFWATACRLGSIGRNGLFYAPGYGSWVFLAEILSTGELPEKHGDAPDWRLQACENCGRCLDACPGHALQSDRTIDCNVCRAYLTIECRDSTLPAGVDLRGNVFGCDICQEVCPANKDINRDNGCLGVRNDIAVLSKAGIEAMDEEKFHEIAAGSALKRITLQQLKRNAGLTTGSDC